MVAEGRRREFGWRAVLAAICGAALVSCGGGGGEGGVGGGGGGETPGDVMGPPPAPLEGRIVVDNQTGFALEVAFLNDADPKAPVIVRTRVESGERQDVSRALLPGGKTVELDLVLLVPEGEGFRVRRKAQVTTQTVVRWRLPRHNGTPGTTPVR